MRFGLPRDPAQIAALLAALIALAFAPRIVRPATKSRLFLALAALTAVALSAAYVALYLRGGPRIIDATSYFLEARALAAGHLAFPLDEPVASTLGRFLVRTDGPDGPTAAVLFPPGYPALLALGFLAHAPLAVGPLLAATLTIATYALAARALPEGTPAADRVAIPRLATLFSVLCAALRYHTADTMSHGLAALCVTSALALALSAVRALEAGERALLPALGAGFFAGWLAATRPPSALALLLALTFLVVTTRSATARASRSSRLTALALLALGALPGLGLLLAHQHAATGELFTSSQRLYYALSDGPPGCFRYGFGASIGCLGEHGDFVQHNLPHGYGAYAAAATTLRRLKQHLVDAGNAEPFTLLVLFGAILAARLPRARLLPIAVALQIAAYVPFYFDGNYPGGGARFYADVLPLEHILAALAVAHLAARGKDFGRASRRVAALVALVPLGFAFRAGFDHALLRDREAGLPMFEPARLASLPARALVFVDTDHGFNLAYDPWTSNERTIARHRGDAFDRFAWEAHGRPPAYRYLFPIPPDGEAPPSTPHLVPYSFDLQAPIALEGENLWPALAQQDAWALPAWATDACASERRWLSVTPADPTKSGAVSLALPAPFLAGRRVAPRLAVLGPASVTVSLVVDGDTLHTHALDPAAAPHPPCVTLPAFSIPRAARSVALTLRLGPQPAHSHVALDRLDFFENESR
ncbi:hypothetical protein [Polyangium mundeleinium]|uniref:Glycosyltransferase RgtA/B/C/D-like domain-containing protein n=1 Tax=Polyangium mundeleinium TaxID=2995306 RepID=A0ABT5EDI9_9BACT|nr:hypothetical protein [Polyangium mundeleinium]MDC0739876.1 hypothetical protein [Polyangium mundeleinium]